MRTRNRKSFASFFTTFVIVLMLVCVFSVTAFAAGTVKYTDISGHWAEATIEGAAQSGLDMLTGDKFYPNAAITRAEFAHMLNWAFGLKTKANSISFLDVDKNDKYYDDIYIGVYSDYIHGYSATQFAPSKNIERQEVCQIFYNILPLYGIPATGTIEKFTDYADISAWALTPVGVITNAKYMIGYEDGSVRPRNLITKAEALTMIMRIVASQNIVHGDFTAKDGDIYKDTIFTGTIYVPAGAKVTFDNCSILGKLVSGTNPAGTRWALPHDTKVANTEYTYDDYNPTPEPEPTPTPPDDDDEDFDVWID